MKENFSRSTIVNYSRTTKTSLFVQWTSILFQNYVSRNSFRCPCIIYAIQNALLCLSFPSKYVLVDFVCVCIFYARIKLIIVDLYNISKTEHSTEQFHIPYSMRIRI